MRSIVCVGYAKCGTTLLDKAFRATDVVAAPQAGKELKFFLPRNAPEVKGAAGYLACFNLERGRHSFTFEASPQYAHQSCTVFLAVLDNIRSIAVDPAVVICVRQPVLRAYSHYVHNLQEFALYGEGVFNKRPDLIRKGCLRTFEEALTETPRLMTRYSRGISEAIKRFGRSRVHLFFVESDSSKLGDWATKSFGVPLKAAEALNEIGQGAPVFSRSPIPNYLVDGGDLIAYGAKSGQYVRYRNVSSQEAGSLLTGRSRWTKSLSPGEILHLTRRHFLDDLVDCATLTGDKRFIEYSEGWGERVAAELADPSLLCSMHVNGSREGLL